ncbi:MAG: TIGR03862 family flavoprotein [Rhodobacteraceae bacterium]|nr:TIGR03862 family flavoprotein [Paracoccaceae bacterium]
MTDAVVIGAGPAGLMAAEMLANAGYGVVVVDHKPSLGRKLLMAGKSGLNLTRDEAFDDFLGNYAEAAQWLRPILAAFSNQDVPRWAEALGQEVFTGTSRRVFPKTMKASPLLRAWLRRLSGLGVVFRTGQRWVGWRDGGLVFQTAAGESVETPRATVLALGGASWPRLGSDGAWFDLLAARGAELTPLRAANMGFAVDWSPHMAGHFGQPIKNCLLIAGERRVRGEFVLSAKGLEGSGIYALSRDLAEGAVLSLDLQPDLDLETLAGRLSRPRGKASLSNHLRKSLKFDVARIALLQEFARPLPNDPHLLARWVKNLIVPLTGPRPLAEAISSAGGIMRSGLDDHLMLKELPGVFAAGEMLDWQAPTGGYLITACLATGRWAGLGAVDWLGR